MNSLDHFYLSYTKKEVEQIVQLKRLFECLEGDPAIKEALSKDEQSSKVWDQLRKIGIHFDSSEISFLWKLPDETHSYLDTLTLKAEEKHAPELSEAISKYPLLLLWGRFFKARHSSYLSWSSDSIDASKNHQFNAWRNRRIAAVKSELGHYGNSITHPIFAYELSEGCSMGCWFCSFATNKLKGYLDYNTYKDFYCNIVHKCIELFGKEAMGWSLPYYRTEPHDNPHYLDYLKEFEKLTGTVFCTSTAVGDDIPWTKELISYYRKSGNPWPRLSILSTEMLKRIHEGLSPMELRDVQLVMQMKENPRKKVTGGRLLEENDGLRNCEETANIKEIEVPQGSIACTTGFLINLVNRTIELFSPCYASNKWPLGYRVFDKAAFKDENNFPQVLLDMILRNMPLSPPPHQPLRFRDDLVYKKTEVGFDLQTPNQIHHFKLQNKCGPLGDLIHSGNMSYADISALLTNQYNIHPIVLKAAVQSLFDSGFIDEVYSCRPDQY